MPRFWKFQKKAFWLSFEHVLWRQKDGKYGFNCPFCARFNSRVRDVISATVKCSFLLTRLLMHVFVYLSRSLLKDG